MTYNESDIAVAQQLWSEFNAGNESVGDVNWDNKWASASLLLYDITGNVSTIKLCKDTVPGPCATSPDHSVSLSLI